jgi:murein L,D-transpeptidase YafK
LPASATADKVLVLKSERRLLLMKGDEVLKIYIVSLGNPVGRKIRQGDRKTPEGSYVLDRHNTHSDYYESIHISYPNAEDVARARKLGVAPGGNVFLHGVPNGFKGSGEGLGDWTDGCISLLNSDMDEIWRAVQTARRSRSNLSRDRTLVVVNGLVWSE